MLVGRRHLAIDLVATTAMHTWYYRLNALLTLATTVLAGMCAVASLTEVLHKSNPQVTASLVQLDGLLAERRNDRAWIVLDIDADLRSIFNWNTKQVYVYVTVDYSTERNQLNRITVFDRIAESVRAAHIKEPKARLPFPFTLSDQGNGLRGRDFNLTVAWQTVPRTGLLLSGERTFTGFKMPEQYVGAAPRRWG